MTAIIIDSGLPPQTKRICAAAGLVLLALAASAGGSQDVLPNIPVGNITIDLKTVATGLGAPDYAISEPDDPSRLFVVDQNGLVRVIQNGGLLPTPALDLRSLVSPPLVTSNSSEERGLLGLAFSPDFNDPGSPGYHTLYTYNSQVNGTSTTYPAPNGAMQNYENAINEWKLSTSNSNVFDPASRREVISFGKNAANHNGGTIAFGPDGYLYLGTGDGGDGDDVGASHVAPDGNAQSLSNALGKILRIDPTNPSLTVGSSNSVSSNGQYRIPADNPFQGAGQAPEIYAYGLRNPYRFSFDTANGQLIAGDVGQNTVEEIDRIVSGGNYGWAFKEGDFPLDRTSGTVGARSPGSPAGLTDPISGPSGTLEYDHGDGIAVIGGFVYHGAAIPELDGKYITGDLSGRLFYADLTTGQLDVLQLNQGSNNYLPNGLQLHGFGEDANGELYVLATNTASSGTGGVVYEITRMPLNLVWTGSASGVWDVDNTANFSGSTSGEFNNGDHVTFGSNGNNRTITIAAGGVAPGSIVFSNSAGKDYSIGGGPIMGSTSLAVSGGGRLGLSGSNTYTGGTIVTNGILEVDNVHALADGTTLRVGKNVLTNFDGAVASEAPAATAPEPGTLVLLLAGLGAGIAVRKRIRYGASHGVVNLVGDAPHWSVDGR